jgi:hypothetical protein
MLKNALQDTLNCPNMFANFFLIIPVTLERVCNCPRSVRFAALCERFGGVYHDGNVERTVSRHIL